MRFLPCLYAFLGCVSFCFIFQVRRPLFILLCSAIGAASWFVYLAAEPLGSDAVRCFVATIVVSSLAEILARVLKAPATIFLVIGIIPLVPGGGLYYTMDYLINQNYPMFSQVGLQTAAIAAAIAVGASMVTSIVRMLTWRKRPH
ncbi:threonine/serine exporter family protein [Dysosmobacter sp.]